MGNDFVHVRLTQAGIDQAAGSPLYVNGRTSVQFMPGQSTRVARYEWDNMLRHTHTALGEPLVELVPADRANDQANEPDKETN